MDNHNVVVYKTESSNVKLEVKVSDETVWLTQTQMAILFDCSTDNISLHLKNIYEEHEIDSDSTSENFSVVRLEGNRRVTRTVKHYNLDAILSVGYRVSSASATKFRQWANSVLKDYLLRGYAVHQRIVYLEQKVSATIYTAHISENLKLDLEKHNSQYQPINIKQFNKSHDRFMIIDNEVYHIGASLKDLGKRMFAFSKMEIGKEIILSIL